MSAGADDLKNSSNDARASARNFSESSPTLGCDKSAPEAARYSRVRLRARRRVVDFGGPSPMSEFSSPLRRPTRWKAKEYGGPATGSSKSAGRSPARVLAEKAESVVASNLPARSLSTNAERAARSGTRRTERPRVGASAGLACVGTYGTPSCRSVSRRSGATLLKCGPKRTDPDRPFAHAPMLGEESTNASTLLPPGRVSAASRRTSVHIRRASFVTICKWRRTE